MFDLYESYQHGRCIIWQIEIEKKEKDDKTNYLSTYTWLCVWLCQQMGEGVQLVKKKNEGDRQVIYISHLYIIK